MLKAYALDLCLFVRKVAVTAAPLVSVLVVSGTLLYVGEAWEGASLLDCIVNAFYLMTLQGVPLPGAWYFELLVFLLPLVAVTLGADGLVRALTLFVSRDMRTGEWHRAMASSIESTLCSVAWDNSGARSVEACLRPTCPSSALT